MKTNKYQPTIYKLGILKNYRKSKLDYKKLYSIEGRRK